METWKQALSINLFCAALCVVLPSISRAQEASVKPGINTQFADPNVEQFINRFEGDGRAIYKHRAEILATLDLKPGMDIADIGAGTGFFSLMIAEKVAPDGTVYAGDIADNFVKHIEARAKEASLANVKPVLCTERSVELPENSIDAAFVCDTYHHFEFPFDTLASIHKALRPGGTLVIVDFERIEGVTSTFSIEHVRAGKGTVTDEVKDAGFDFVNEVDIMDDQFVLRFTKRPPKDDSKPPPDKQE